MITKVTVSPEGEIVIPKEALDDLSLEPGTEFTLLAFGNSISLKRIYKEIPDWRTMRGMAKGGESLTKALEEEHREELAREDARLKNSWLLGLAGMPGDDTIDKSC